MISHCNKSNKKVILNHFTRSEDYIKNKKIKNKKLNDQLTNYKKY